MMQRYSLKFLGAEKIAEGTYAFKLDKPNNLLFKPGQYMEVYNGGASHTFSIASAPHEDYLMFATRMREGSSFKKDLMNLNTGDVLEVDAPAGTFVLPKEKELAVVLIAGGIGITPIRSIVKAEEYNKSTRNITVLYSNRMPKTSAFLDELESVDLQNYRFIATMTEIANSSDEWHGEEGYIDINMITKYVADLALPIFYVVGPPTFVTALNDLLSSIETVPSNHIRAEDFTGYK